MLCFFGKNSKKVILISILFLFITRNNAQTLLRYSLNRLKKRKYTNPSNESNQNYSKHKYFLRPQFSRSQVFFLSKNTPRGRETQGLRHRDNLKGGGVIDCDLLSPTCLNVLGCFRIWQRNQVSDLAETLTAVIDDAQ